MIGLDTNVVIRYLVQDDLKQASAATALIDELTETDPGFLSLVSIVEVYWVLRRAYGAVALFGRAAPVLRCLGARQQCLYKSTIATDPRSH